MTLILQAHKDAIYDWIYSVKPTYEIIWNNQDIPKPKDNYIVLGVITSGNLDCKADKLYPDGSDKIKYRTYKNLTLTIDVFSQADYFQTMDLIIDSQFFDDVRLNLKKAGLAIRQSMPVIDLTGLDETAFTKRCKADFILAYTVDRTRDADRISRIKGEVDGIEFDVEQ